MRGARRRARPALRLTLVLSAVASIALGLFGCALGPGDSAATVELAPLPWPDLSAADGRVVEQLEGQRAQLTEPTRAELRAGSRDALRLAEEYSEMGLLLLTYEYMEAADACFDNAIRLAPEDSRWAYLRGYLAAMTGDLQLAERLLVRSTELSTRLSTRLSPDHLPGTVRLAEVRLDLGQSEQARALFEQALEKDPELPRALAGLARLAVEAGEDERAIALYSRALALAPAANSLHYSLSQAYRRLGDIEKAEYHLVRRGDIQVPLEDPLLERVPELGRSAAFFLTRASQAMKNQRYDIAADSYRDALELDPSDFGAYRGLAFALDELGDAEGAAAVLEQALARASTGDGEQDRNQRADIHRRLGEMAVLAGDDERAIASFSKGLEEVAERADLRQLLANALARRGRFEEALGHYDFVLEGLPEDAATLVRRGAALINLGRAERALADFRAAVAVSPDDMAVRRQYLAALEHVGDEAGAAEQRRLLGELSASSGTVASLLAEGQAAVSAGEHPRALEILQRAVAADASSFEARLLLASVLGHLGRFDEAAAEFRSVIERSPRNEAAWRGELTALLLSSRYSEARERLREALELYPRSVALGHTLARLLVSSPTSEDRNGPLGLQLAERVRSFEDSIAAAETLAMALAEMERYEEAADLQRDAIERGGGEEGSARLRAYRDRRPWVLQRPDELVSLLMGDAGR